MMKYFNARQKAQACSSSRRHLLSLPHKVTLDMLSGRLFQLKSSIWRGSHRWVPLSRLCSR